MPTEQQIVDEAIDAMLTGGLLPNLQRVVDAMAEVAGAAEAVVVLAERTNLEACPGLKGRIALLRTTLDQLREAAG